MASPTLSELVGDQKPVVAYPKKIKFGPVELEGYMLENGEFRQSISSTERALGFAKNSRILTRLRTSKDGTELNQSLAANPLPLKGSDDAEAQNSHPETSVLLPVRCPGVMHHTSIAYTINPNGG